MILKYIGAIALCLARVAIAQSELTTIDRNVAADAVYPSASWAKIEHPDELSWSTEKLATSRKESESIGSAAVVIVHGGKIIAEWGEPAKRYYAHSIRKSFLSAFYGIPSLAEKIDLNATMADLGIDDNEPALTATEKLATVRQLLQARSGVYHLALAETEPMKRRRPMRQPRAGFVWYYNNWDFNALGTIFRSAQVKAFSTHSMSTSLARSRWKTSVSTIVALSRGPDSIHAAYKFRMTARDMARFGLLFARGGQWQGKQIVPAAWVAESTTTYSPATGEDGKLRCGYGYLWWTEYRNLQLQRADLPAGSFSARGSGGHYILVVPAWDLVVVHRMDTDNTTGPRAPAGSSASSCN